MSAEQWNREYIEEQTVEWNRDGLIEYGRVEKNTGCTDRKKKKTPYLEELFGLSSLK